MVVYSVPKIGVLSNCEDCFFFFKQLGLGQRLKSGFGMIFIRFLLWGTLKCGAVCLGVLSRILYLYGE